MKDRFKAVRTDAKMTQAAFAESVHVSRNYIAQIEMGIMTPGDNLIRAICQTYGIREEWLRDGTEPMYASTGREEEMARLVRRLMSDSPDSFQSALVTTLLRFDPEGPEWEILERIYNNIAAEMDSRSKEASE